MIMQAKENQRDEEDKPSKENIDSSSKSSKKPGAMNATAVETTDTNIKSSKKVKETTSVKEKLESSLRRRRAKADIQRLSVAEDAPFDVTSALQALKSDKRETTGVPTPLNATLAQHEDKVQQIEERMQELSRQHSFLEAAQLRDELYRLHLEDCGLVLQANHAFYKAMSSKRYEDMLDIWHADDTIECIFPSYPPFVGYDAVMQSWKETFQVIRQSAISPYSSVAAKSNEPMHSSLQANTIEPHEVRLSIKGNTVYLSCEEHVFGTSFQRGVGRKREVIKKFLATNIFRKVVSHNDGGKTQWKLVHHHGSWHVDHDPLAQQITPTQAGVRDSRFRNLNNGDLEERTSAQNDKVMGDAVSKIVFGHPSLMTKEKEQKKGGSGGVSSLEKLLGLGGLSGPSSGGLGGLGSGQPEGQSVRIFKGSLSDLLKSGLFSGSSSSDEGIIEMEEVDDDGDMDEEFYLDGDDDDDDDEDDEAATAQAVIQINSILESDEENKHKKDVKKGNITGQDKQTTTKTSVAEANEARDKDELRQNCIGALRRLCDQGSISQKQKRVLLTDIITCSARGDFSMVEVAFELLCGKNGNEVDEIEEEFADQCRVFANNLLLQESSSSLR